MSRYKSGMNFTGSIKVIPMIFMILLLGGCTKYRAPELRAIEGLRLKMRGGDQIELYGKLIFYNPNQVKFKLKSYHLNIYIEEKKITELKDHTKMIIYPEQDFSLNAVANFTIKDLDGNILQSALGLISSRITVHFEGNIKLNRNGVNITIPVDHYEKVKF